MSGSVCDKFEERASGHSGAYLAAPPPQTAADAHERAILAVEKYKPQPINTANVIDWYLNWFRDQVRIHQMTPRQQFIALNMCLKSHEAEGLQSGRLLRPHSERYYKRTMTWPPQFVDELWAWVKTIYLTNAIVDRISRDSVLPDWPMGPDKKPISAKEFWHKIPDFFARFAEVVTEGSLPPDLDVAYKTAYLRGIGTDNAAEVRFRAEARFGTNWTFQQLADCLEGIRPKEDTISPELNTLGKERKDQKGRNNFRKRSNDSVDDNGPRKCLNSGGRGRKFGGGKKDQPPRGPQHSWKKNNGGPGCFRCGESNHTIDNCPDPKMSDGEILWRAARLQHKQRGERFSRKVNNTDK